MGRGLREQRGAPASGTTPAGVVWPAGAGRGAAWGGWQRVAREAGAALWLGHGTALAGDPGHWTPALAGDPGHWTPALALASSCPAERAPGAGGGAGNGRWVWTLSPLAPPSAFAIGTTRVALRPGPAQHYPVALADGTAVPRRAWSRALAVGRWWLTPPHHPARDTVRWALSVCAGNAPAGDGPEADPLAAARGALVLLPPRFGWA